MTLATDILNRAGVNLAPPPPKRKVTRRGKIATAAPKPCAIRSEGRDLHMARVYGLYHREDGWETQVFDGRQRIRLGVFHSIPRARVAQKLWRYWRYLGFSITDMRGKWVEVRRRQIAD